MSWLVFIGYTVLVFGCGFVSGWCWRDTPRARVRIIEEECAALPPGTHAVGGSTMTIRDGMVVRTQGTAPHCVLEAGHEDDHLYLVETSWRADDSLYSGGRDV